MLWVYFVANQTSSCNYYLNCLFYAVLTALEVDSERNVFCDYNVNFEESRTWAQSLVSFLRLFLSQVIKSNQNAAKKTPQKDLILPNAN